MLSMRHHIRTVLWIGLIALCATGVRAADPPAAPSADAFAKRADWWSFKPIVRPEIPKPDAIAKWGRNPIDAFVLERMAREGLNPSAEADRRTLIRRVTFDLTGLPPTPEEIDAFVADPAPDAYERLVDRLLASPRYGERWARHWLDVVHYGDTHGYDKDKIRPNAWPYRDYVIRAFNQDKPYSRFVREQLAGDALYSDDPDGVVATGFIVAGPWDFVGHVEVSETTTNGAIARNLDRDDMVMNTMSAFTSLTVHCARCHNHKFDAITQLDYYSLQAVFAGIGRNDRSYDPDPAVAHQRTELLAQKKSLEASLAAVDQKLARVKPAEVAVLDREIEALHEQLKPVDVAQPSPSNGYHSAISLSQDVTKWVQVDLGTTAPIDRIRLMPARPTDFPDTPGFGFPIRYKVEVANEPTFAQPIVLVDHTAANVPNPGDHPVDINGKQTTARFVRVTATKLWKRLDDYVLAFGELEVVSEGKLISRGAAVASLDSIEAGRWSGRALVDGFDSRHRVLSDAGLPAQAELQHSIDQRLARRDELIRQSVDPALRDEAARCRTSLAAVSTRLAALPAAHVVFAAASHFEPAGNHIAPPGGKPRPIHVLMRGNVTDPREQANAGAVAAVSGPPSARFALANPEDEASRRAALAEWIVDPRNPLTWRSAVNRVWHYHFGRGIVESTNDFGHMGTLPSHPELLDWLAAEFRDGGKYLNAQSIKSLHRLIVTSATYRQSSAGDAAREKVDAGNRLLWRMNRRRLEAEAIRDSVLSVSGKLDLTMGGPGYYLFGFLDDHSPHYLYEQHDPDDPKSLRRTIYRFIVRSVPDPFMTTLDCPDPSLINDKRFETVTALQSLAMLNDTFIVRQAQHFAERVDALAPEGPGRIEAAYRLALGRSPTREESEQLVAYVQKNGMPNLCRVIFNLNEFVFVD